MNSISGIQKSLIKQSSDMELMNEPQFLDQLGQQLQKLTEQPAFEVSSIATHKEKWICVDKNDKRSYSEKAKVAENCDIFNLVATDGNKILGYINRLDLNEGQLDRIVRWNEKSLDAESKLTVVIDEMVNDSSKIDERERSPLYFVNSKLNGKSEPLGIVTFWDLNRAPAYTLSYTCMIYLEHTLFNLIKERHETWEDHASLVEKCTRREVKSFLRSPKPSIEKISKNWVLGDLIEFCKVDSHVSPWCKEID